MKIIESLDEWWEANQSNRLEIFSDSKWLPSEKFSEERLVSPHGIKKNIESGLYRWKPEQIKLVEIRTIPMSLTSLNPIRVKWVEDGEFIPPLEWELTGRTCTATIEYTESE